MADVYGSGTTSMRYGMQAKTDSLSYLRSICEFDCQFDGCSTM
jgi:hypothetical protein